MSTARRSAVRPGGDVLCRVLECVSLSASRSRVLRIRMRHEPACVCRSECELSERRPATCPRAAALREGRERPRAAGRRGATRPTRPPGPLPTPPRPAARRSRAGSRSRVARPAGVTRIAAPGSRGRESQNGETANSVNGAPVRRGSGRARRRGGRRACAAGSLSHDASRNSRSTKPVSHLAVPGNPAPGARGAGGPPLRPV
jgi:hypothetical protein